MTTAEGYATIATAAYNADPLAKNPPYAPGQQFHPPGKPGLEFEVVPPPPASDPVTGFQAMTVVPVTNGKPDYSQVYLSYAGTNPGDHADISADAQIVVGGRTGPGTQAAQALEYAQKAMATVRAEHPEAGFETVGHSLGGYFAAYVAGELHVHATAFNGPDPWDALSDQAKKWYVGEVAAGRRPWDRYVNEWDLIGNYLGDASNSAIYARGKPEQKFFANHNIATGFDWNPDGSVKGAGASGRSLTEISENLLSGLPEGMRSHVSPLLTGAVSLLQNPVAGATAGMLASQLTVTMDTLAASSMAANILQIETPLRSIKAANSALIPQMEQGLLEAQNAVMMIPCITVTDINNCVATHRLNVHQNIDAEAVAAVNKRVDEHITLVHQLVTGIGTASRNALAQDAQWAQIYSSR